jgi:uncharacterized protein (TIGR02757 family)
MNRRELKDFLDAKAAQYQQSEFLQTDPIQIPHLFDNKEDIEISGFLTATIAWGNRKSIIRSAREMMQRMDDAPFEYVRNAGAGDLKRLDDFVHRTFNGSDFTFFVRSLREIYRNHGGLEGLFTPEGDEMRLQGAISRARAVFMAIPHEARSEKHFSDPLRGSAAKRINMFLRWMVRSSITGVDFGIWHQIRPSQLSCPLDVHSGKVARRLGLLRRKQNDAKALYELDQALRRLDKDDPVKYDFALFGLGVFEGFG